jgi:hypothetical protein
MGRVFENPANGFRQEVGASATLGAVVLGPIYFALVGAWGWALAEFLISCSLILGLGAFGVLPAILFQLCVALLAQKIAVESYLKKGWREVSADSAQPQAAADKTCPECAETIKAEAKICRFCRHAFD